MHLDLSLCYFGCVRLLLLAMYCIWHDGNYRKFRSVSTTAEACGFKVVSMLRTVWSASKFETSRHIREIGLKLRL